LSAVCLCCQVEVSATSWSLVHRSPTDCDASLCVIQKPRELGGPGPLGAVAPKTNKQMCLQTTWPVPTLMCQPTGPTTRFHVHIVPRLTIFLITKAHRVYCAVRAESWTKIQVNFVCKVVPWLRRLAAGPSLRWHRLDHRSVRVRFVVRKVALRQGFLYVSQFPPCQYYSISAPYSP
jgi:hypothetical protein